MVTGRTSHPASTTQNARGERKATIPTPYSHTHPALFPPLPADHDKGGGDEEDRKAHQSRNDPGRAAHIESARLSSDGDRDAGKKERQEKEDAQESVSHQVDRRFPSECWQDEVSDQIDAAHGKMACLAGWCRSSGC